jgi:hypothetical protein
LDGGDRIPLFEHVLNPASPDNIDFPLENMSGEVLDGPIIENMVEKATTEEDQKNGEVIWMYQDEFHRSISCSKWS